MVDFSQKNTRKSLLPRTTAMMSAWIALMCVSCIGGGKEKLPPATEEQKDSLVELRKRGKTLRDESRFDEALEIHSIGLKLAKATHDTAEWVQALNNIGTDYRRMGVLDVAQEYHYEAWRMCEESKDTTRVMRKNRVVSLNGLGNIYLTVRNYDKAEDAFRSALAGETELGSNTGQAINYANLGAIYFARDNDRKALEYYNLSLQMNMKDSNLLGMTLCHTYLGNLHEKRGHYGEARKEYMTAYNLSRNMKDTWHSVEPLLALVSLGLDTKDYAAAEKWLRTVEDMTKGMNSTEHLAEVNRLYYRLFKAKGHYTAALERYEKATTYSDSLVDMDKNNRIHNVGLSIERKRQNQMVQAAKDELNQEKTKGTVWIWSSVTVTVFLLVIIGLMGYLQRLRAARLKMLREMSQMRENLFTNITHEFRTPLTVILGLSKDIGERTSIDQETRRKLQAINRQGNRLLTLITQLLDISRVKSGLATPEWRNGNIVAYIGMVVESFRDYATGKGVELRMEPDRNGEICMDFVPDYINKVVTNLLSNALKFTAPGGQVSISITEKGSIMAMDIKDTGCGIAREQLTDVFKPFFTDNRGGDGSGTGIGLALTKNIIDSLNGSITVDSETGKGTAFHVELPIRQTAAQAYTPGSTEFAQAEYTDTDTQTESMETHAEERKDAPLVLVMEDNKDVADYMGTLLEKEYNVMYASNGKEGLEKAHERIPDLIITDLMMPEMDGLEVCRNIRADELVNHVPIIVATAKITEEDRVKGLQCGADAYLSKPFNAEELMTRAQKLLEQRRLLREKYAAQAQAALATVLAENTETEQETMARETTPEDMFITKTDKAIDDMLVAFEDVTVASLAEKTGVTARQLHRKLTATVGLNPNAYIQQKKIGKAQKLLMDNPEIPLKNVAYDCGFSDYSYFTRVFKNLTGISPGEMRKSAKGQGH